ncbi:MAG: LacI family DNA-binding transcriptional regulator [Armatimonadota bacterium]|nr:LacI family DNA-binding transcriptional regulator [Armatimonadota bacterium]
MTIEDVARAVGVSPSTVSRALQDAPVISAATRRRVARAAARLGYVPNQAARSLVTRTTRTFGLMIPDVTDPVHGQVVTGFEQAAAEAGYTVIMANGFADPQRERRAIALFLAHRADGVALMGSVLPQARVRATVRPAPVVFINGEHVALAGYASDLATGCIRSDDLSGIDALVRHLVEGGRRRIGYAHGRPSASDLTRRDAAARALRRAVPGSRLIEYGGEGWRSESALAGLIARDRPDAVLCYDDKLALRTIAALRTLGVRVPGDIAVAGFDDIPFAALSNPALTTVAQRSEEMGRLAVGMLRSALERAQMPRSITLPVQLVVRESTARRR